MADHKPLSFSELAAGAKAKGYQICHSEDSAAFVIFRDGIILGKISYEEIQRLIFGPERAFVEKPLMIEAHHG